MAMVLQSSPWHPVIMNSTSVAGGPWEHGMTGLLEPAQSFSTLGLLSAHLVDTGFVLFPAALPNYRSMLLDVISICMELCGLDFYTY